METLKEKPPTITVGVQGFVAEKPMGQDPAVDWVRIIEIPKFQMFMCERTKHSHENVMEWIAEACVTESSKLGDANLLWDEYCKWHDNLGYWKNENYYGELT